LKNMVYTYIKDFSWENGSKFGRHWIFFFKLPDLAKSWLSQDIMREKHLK
jgi:hypothetical protein